MITSLSVVLICWAEAPEKIARMTLTIKLDGNWSSFQLANSAPPLSVTDSAIAPSARIPTSSRATSTKITKYCHWSLTSIVTAVGSQLCLSVCCGSSRICRGTCKRLRAAHNEPIVTAIAWGHMGSSMPKLSSGDQYSRDPVQARLRPVGLLFCLGWCALLWRGWQMDTVEYYNPNSQGYASLASVGRVVLLLRWLGILYSVSEH